MQGYGGSTLARAPLHVWAAWQCRAVALKLCARSCVVDTQHSYGCTRMHVQQKQPRRHIETGWRPAECNTLALALPARLQHDTNPTGPTNPQKLMKLDQANALARRLAARNFPAC
eukprot:366145-Chlamydomonas_euryale.AAC.9